MRWLHHFVLQQKQAEKLVRLSLSTSRGRTFGPVMGRAEPLDRSWGGPHLWTGHGEGRTFGLVMGRAEPLDWSWGAGLGIRSFAHRSFAHSLILLKSNEQL